MLSLLGSDCLATKKPRSHREPIFAAPRVEKPDLPTAFIRGNVEIQLMMAYLPLPAATYILVYLHGPRISMNLLGFDFSREGATGHGEFLMALVLMRGPKLPRTVLSEV